MSHAYAEIAAAITDYFDGFHHGDVARLKRVFHPNCHLYGGTGGPLADEPMDVVYARVMRREPPAARGQVRHDRILTIDLSGPETALVKLQIAIGPRLYTDYLSLLKLDDRWRIVAKVYTWVPIEETATRQAAAE